MRKISQITLVTTVFLCLTASMAALFLHCNQTYDNPVSSKYEGDYKCTVNWNGLNEKPHEILKSYTFTISDTGKDKYYKFEVTTEPAISFKSESDKQNRVKISFLEPFTGKLTVVAIRPNLEKDYYGTSVSVINPYVISGDTMVGKNVPAALFISRVDSEKPDTHFSVIWDTSSVPFDTASVLDKVNLGYGSRNSVKINAIIFTEAGSYKIGPFTVRFEGEAPEIGYVRLIDSLRMGEFPQIEVQFTDDDTGMVFFSVYASAHNKLLTSSPFSATGGNTVIICDVAVSDTAVTSLSIVATDKNGLASIPKTIPDLHVQYTIPEVEFLNTSDTVYFKHGDSPRFIASGVADSFLWVIDDNVLVMGTKENSVKLNPIMDTLWHTISLTGVNYTFVKGNTDKITYKAKISKYTLEEVKPFPSEIRIRKWFSWEVRTLDALKRNVNSDSVRYVWSYPQSCRDSMNEDGSSLYLFFEDSVKSSQIEVMAIVGSDSSFMDTTVPLFREVTTRKYKPKCVFDLQNDSTVKFNDSVSFKVTMKFTDPDGGLIDTVFYKVVSPVVAFTEKRNANDVWGYRFREKGSHYLITWAADSYNVKSDYDTLKIDVITDKPVFNPGTVKKTVYAKDSVRLIATIDTHPHIIRKYFWYLDEDSIVDQETDNNFIDKVFEETGTYKIRVDCVNILNDSAAKPLEITVTVSPNNPVIKKVSYSKPVYINDKCTLTVKAEDYGKNKGIVQYQYSTDAVTFYPMSDSTLDTVFNTPGKKLLYFKVMDNLNLLSDVYCDSVEVRRGIPVIDSVNVKYSGDSLYVKDAFKLKISASDTNGTVSSVFISWNGDTIAEDSVIFIEAAKACTASFGHQFDTNQSGERNVKVWTVDDDNQRSVFYDKKILVSKGAPVVKEVSPAVAWVVKPTKFSIKATDPNSDSVKIKEIKFEPNGPWIMFTTDTVSYAFDTFAAGQKKIWVRVTDDDFISTTSEHIILVNMGRPVVGKSNDNENLKIRWFAGTPDTMIYTYSFNEHISNISVNAYDINGGKCSQYKWTIFFGGTIQAKTTDTNILQTFIEKHTYARMSVTVLDDDGIPSFPYDFFVFPDEAPPEPTTFQNTISGDSVVLMWGKKVDSYDSMETKVQILICQGGECDLTDKLFDPPKTLSELETAHGTKLIGSTMYSRVAFIPSFSGEGRWKVILIDRHRNEAPGTVQTFYTPD